VKYLNIFFQLTKTLPILFLLNLPGQSAYANDQFLSVATRINGESLIYFGLLGLILYLFFRKPLP